MEARNAESSYNTRLRQVARNVGALVQGFAPDGVVKDMSALQKALAGYAELLGPWAVSVANYMVADVMRRDAKVWRSYGKEMGRALRIEIDQAPTGVVYREMMDEQVALIKSLPLKEGQRIHKLTDEALVSGRRAEDIKKEIMRTTAVTESRARMIARTEVSRTASLFTQARAMAAGSEGYIWRTVRDGDVRHTHEEMEGKYVRWDTPPKTDKGLAPYHAGCGPNCRCYAEPVLPDL